MKEAITFKRFLIAGVWGTVVFLLAINMIETEAFLLMLPILALPWVFFHVNDQRTAGKAVEAGDIFLALVCGSFFTAVFSLPMIVAVIFIRKL